MDCEYEDLKGYINITAVSGITWSNAKCYIFVHSCVGGACVFYILYVLTDFGQKMQVIWGVALCWWVGSSQHLEMLRSFLNAAQCLPNSTASQSKRLESSAALCEPQMLCDFGLLIITLHLVTFWTPEWVLGTVPSVWFVLNTDDYVRYIQYVWCSSYILIDMWLFLAEANLWRAQYKPDTFNVFIAWRFLRNTELRCANSLSESNTLMSLIC